MIETQPLKWHGGKSYLAKWLHSLAPPSCIDDPANGYTHRNITCAGGLGEFWNWLPIDGISEAVNDANCDLSHFYAVLADETLFGQLLRRLGVTPLSEIEWKKSEGYGVGLSYPYVECAAQFFTRYRQSRQGLVESYCTPTRRTRRGMNENVSAWLSAVDGLPECHARLRRVEIRNLDCIEFIRKYDHPRALFYCDPPYLAETRSSGGEYGPHEMSDDRHAELLGCLATIGGKFMLSGYRSDLYQYAAERYGWKCHEKVIDNKAAAGAVKDQRIECVWCNY